MFCERCGTQLPETAEFCTNCGTRIATVNKRVTAEKIPDTDIQLRVQPTFKLAYMILPSVILFGIFILVFSLIIGIISAGLGLGVFLAGTLIMFIILGIEMAFKKKQYDNFCYDFYKTKVIYKDSFINLSEKEVKYKYIREVTMRQTFIQRFFNIGNIVLYTNAETGFANGIFIMNVENVQDVYRDIKSVIDV